jgi:transposase
LECETGPTSVSPHDRWYYLAFLRDIREKDKGGDVARGATGAVDRTAEAWLAQQSQICIVARDRGGGYAVATRRAATHAIQVADRWHLMENASGAFLDAVRKSMRQVRTAMGASVIDPSLLTSAEKLQYEGYVRREETNAAILSLSQQGIAIKEIVRRTGYSRGLIRKILRGRQSSLDPYLP